jgi:hypothetical protein
MKRATEHFTESQLRKALRKVSSQQEKNGGNMILWDDAENIRRLRDACRQQPEKSLLDVATEMAFGFEVL